jgi:hypothetical protein
MFCSCHLGYWAFMTVVWFFVPRMFRLWDLATCTLSDGGGIIDCIQSVIVPVYFVFNVAPCARRYQAQSFRMQLSGISILVVPVLVVACNPITDAVVFEAMAGVVAVISILLWRPMLIVVAVIVSAGIGFRLIGSNLSTSLDVSNPDLTTTGDMSFPSTPETTLSVKSRGDLAVSSPMAFKVFSNGELQSCSITNLARCKQSIACSPPCPLCDRSF